MSTQHLKTGSTEPPRVPGRLRLYSNKYCPYVQRVRLVLKAKGVDHDIVNIHLKEKPEWYLKVNPNGKVPALLDGDKIIVESLDIADYLDNKFPQNPLYSSDPAKKQKEKELIQKSNDVFDALRGLLTNKDKTPEQHIQEISVLLLPFEEELAKRGTTFIGGDKPGMVDYMLWPASDRLGLLSKDVKLPKEEDSKIPHLRKWTKDIKQIPICAELSQPAENYAKLFKAYATGGPVDYDF